MREPKIRFISPLELKSKIPDPPISQFSSIVVKGLVRGLLTHLWNQDRRKTREVGVSQLRLERALMIYLGVAQGLQLGDESLMRKMECDLPVIFSSFVGHTYLVLCADSDLILLALKPYSRLKRNNERVAWLQKELPGILEAIKKYTLCSECSLKTKIPGINSLTEWACTRNSGELRDRILGHAHGLKPATVKRIMASKPQAPQTI